MSKKMSYVVAVENAINGKLDEETVERLGALKVSLEKRASHKPNGPTKAQRERAEVAEKVAEAMVAGEGYGSAQIAELVPELNGASSQKVTGVMKGLVAAGTVKSEKVKGKTVYTLA